MRVVELIEEFQEKLDNKGNFMMTNKVLIEREELEELLTNLKTFLPDEVKQAKWIRDERDKIVGEAKEQARVTVEESEQKQQQMINEAKREYETLVSNTEVMKEAELRARNLLENARQESENIREESYRYSQSMLLKTRQDYEKMLNVIEQNLNELDNFL